MIRTRAGYAGGEMHNPDYGHLGDHTETVQVDFDPERVTYAQLLEVFWKSHNPHRRSWSRQYRHAVFYHDAGQKRAALASRNVIEQKSGRIVRTEVLPVKTFYRAEDYHQKYILRNRSDLARELSRVYPRTRDFVDSTAAARMNGYVGGYGSPEQLAREIKVLGLRPESRKWLEMVVRRSVKQ